MPALEELASKEAVTADERTMAKVEPACTQPVVAPQQQQQQQQPVQEPSKENKENKAHVVSTYNKVTAMHPEPVTVTTTATKLPPPPAFPPPQTPPPYHGQLAGTSAVPVPPPMPPPLPERNYKQPCTEVGKWLLSIDLQRYAEQFTSNGFTTLHQLRDASVSDLRSVGVTSDVDRTMILEALRRLPDEESASNSSSSNATTRAMAKKAAGPDALDVPCSPGGGESVYAERVLKPQTQTQTQQHQHPHQGPAKQVRFDFSQIFAQGTPTLRKTAKAAGPETDF